MNTASRTIRAGGIDWVAHWFELVEHRRIVIEGLASQGPQTGFWDTRAGRFAQRAQATDPTTDPLTLGLLDLVKDGETVLDVGAGTGRYAFPLAGVASRVTAVEPAAAMRTQFEQAITAREAQNITLVPGKWENAEVEPHDLVLCANVLYPIADITPFILKLDAHARRLGVIIIRVDQMGAMVDPLWNEIWGLNRPPEPGLLDLYNLLFALGIRADVRLAQRAAAQRYADIEDAFGQARNQLFLPADNHQHDDRIRAFLVDALVPSGTGFEAPHNPQYALASWEKA